MKLVSFRVYNYKSIIDSKECYLSPSDGITVIAGQNESGKSSLLQALKDYEQRNFDEEAKRDDEPFKQPIVECVFDKSADSNFNAKAKIYWSDEFYNDFVLYFFEKIKNIHIKCEGSNIKPNLSFFGETFIELEKWVEILKDTDLENDAQVLKNFKGIKLRENNRKSNKKFFELEYTAMDLSYDLAPEVHKIAPHIIMFDDFCDLLPDTILVSDLKSQNEKAKGFQAVKNIEKILDTDLVEFDALVDNKRVQKQDFFRKTITANFNQRWKQRIGNENGAIIHTLHFQGSGPNAAYFKFFVETKSGELLEPNKRSQGFKWFLSFYLHLVAEDKRKDGLIILFDEPGLHLHSKAQSDMMSVFEDLAEKNQIIYSTHSPYLIDSNKLHRIRLIINTNEGTKVEKLTTNANGKAHDALKPIIDAIGLDMRNSFSPSMGGKNVIVEGISDYYYFKSFMYLHNISDNIYFLPAMGASNAHLLMELCMGWGLDWLMVFDEKGTKREVANIKKKFFPLEEEMKDKIHILKGMDGIEDMFAIEDFKLAVPEIEQHEGEALGKAVSRHSTKELVARIFSDKVFGNEITLANLNSATAENFKSVFNFIKGL
ncbi:AAA family ATPase [Hymenobacter sp. BT188]|uniref:ATP-dependent nuclease n=1 Tax=Hymenobacter sp. BT188 TaxID=2763504 RepID=UPI0016513CF3|nr:AAA family ATPase [Hymenobacter sp. BT188]MBC6606159.1 AAA family ATPase [Hymenobacter sp. BT188]